jgi:DNA polymerase-4
MRDWLVPLSVANLWGAGPKTAERLRALGYETIGRVAAAAPGELERAFGALGRRFFALANGVDQHGVQSSRRAHGVSSERTLKIGVSVRAEMEAYLWAAADTVATRLRRSKRRARGIRIKLKTTRFRVLTRQALLAERSDVAAVLFAPAAELLEEVGENGPFRLVGLGAYDFDAAGQASGAQLDLLPAAGARERRLEAVIDELVVADELRRLVGQLLLEHAQAQPCALLDDAFVRLLRARDQLQRRRFADAVTAHQAHALTRLDREIGAAEHALVSEAYGDAIEAHKRGHGIVCKPGQEGQKFRNGVL